MKSSLFSTISAIALTGLCFTFAPSTASAHDGGRGAYHPAARCNRLPVGCRTVFYGGRRCWFGGGQYYACNPLGGYVVIAQQPQEVDTSDVSQTDGDDSTLSCLPDGCATVWIGGERCWSYNGCYYRRCGRGYARFNYGHRDSCGRGVSTRPVCKSRGVSCSTHTSCNKGSKSRCKNNGHGRR